MVGQIATRAVPAPIQVGRRWVIERTHAWATRTASCAGAPSGDGWSSTSGWRWSAPLWSVAAWSAAPGPATAGTAAHDHLLAQPLSGRAAQRSCSTGLGSSQHWSLACWVSDAVNVLPCAACPTLTADPVQPGLPFQDHASFPAAPRPRTWRQAHPVVDASRAGRSRSRRGLAWRDSRREAWPRIL
jgi:hypothetical protein